MNRIFNIIWSVTKEKWVVVSEKVKSNGKVPKSSLLSIAVFSAIFAASAAAYALDPGALPEGVQITAGAGSVATSGNSMTVNQSSQQMIANWNSFNIGQDASVHFVQPNVSSTALNRIADQNPTQIFGSLSANGQVFLLNPSGIIFGKNARVDVGGLVASSLDMSDSDFLASRYKFSNGGNAGEIINQGSINIIPGGVVALIGTKVTNEGVVNVGSGSVALAAGNQVSLDLKGDGLITLAVDEGTVDALAQNKGLLKADGGLVIMTAKAADALTQSAVNNSGIIQARSLQQKDGHIMLDAVGGMTTVSGTLDASSPDGKGGQVVATGDRVLVKSGAHLTASGLTGGGEVLVGGNWQGKDTSIHQATGTIVESGALLEANSTDTGNGGTVVAWSDVTNPLSVTRAYGTFEAMGGPKGGDGGRIETSGHWLDVAGSQGGASATLGQGGLWLFDPYNVTIDNVSPEGAGSYSGTGALLDPYIWTPSASGSHILNTDISDKLDKNYVVTVTTTGGTAAEPGNITVSAPIRKTLGSSDATLNLDAAGSIIINAQIINTVGTLNINLKSGTGSISGIGDITGNGNGAMTFNVGGNVSGTYSGNITDRTSLDKLGQGTLILAGNNSYTGLTDILAGTLKATNTNALGTKLNGTRVENGATLEIGSDIANQEFLQLNGNGVNNGGALVINGGNYTFSGAIQLQTASLITATGGTLTLTNTAEGVYGSGGLTVSGTGGVIFNGSIGSGSYLNSFTGSAGTTLTIKGGVVNTHGSQTYNGPTTFDATSGSLTTLRIAQLGNFTGLGVITVANNQTLTFEGIPGQGVNVDFINPLNDFSTVSATYVNNVRLIDKNALTLSNIDGSGTIDIATLTNDLTVSGLIMTSNATATALILNAGKNEIAGTKTGGDIILDGGTISVGLGGRATLYTGSISGSSALASYISLSGTGRFRYNRDELTTYSSLDTPLASGLYGIYREQPVLNVTPSSHTMFYGDSLPLFTVALYEGYVNGDTDPILTSANASWGVDGDQSASFNYIAGPHNVRYTGGLVSGFGYGFTDKITSTNELTITARP
ncbi:MAG: filamentous hemagglutinin N-terminal domain-containing protein, partial [Chlorobium sp.]